MYAEAKSAEEGFAVNPTWANQYAVGKTETVQGYPTDGTAALLACLLASFAGRTERKT